MVSEAVPTPESQNQPTGPSVSETRRSYVEAQLASLNPYDFVVVGLANPPFDAARIRREDGGGVTVDVGTRESGDPYTEDQAAALSGLGFVRDTTSWRAEPAPASDAAAVALVERVVTRVFGATESTPIDVRHGSDRAEHEAQRKQQEMVDRIAPVLTAMLGREAERDSDGDFIVDIGESRVFVAPRAIAGRPPVVRVFTITNAGLATTAELGLYLARLNFTLMFGRFSIDMQNSSVWFDETLLGDHVADEELTFTVGMVATIAGEWAVKIAQTFGGGVPHPKVAESPALPKPGQGGYL